MRPAAGSLTTPDKQGDREVWVTPSQALPVIWLDVVEVDSGMFLAAALTPEQARKVARDLLAVAP